jgi:hypothetical protein
MDRTKLSLIAILFIVFTLACNTIIPTVEPPGVGEKADKGYKLSEPIIAALEQYKAGHGSYPQKLDELAPDYLPVPPVSTDEIDFFYSITGESYSFSFHYIGPGTNTCTYKPETKKWNCYGAY